MYMDYINEFLLPDQNLDLYVVDSFVFDLQKIEQAPHRSASARITHSPQPQYHGDDPILEGPTFPATQDLIKEDLPRCTFLSMQAGTSRDLPVCTNLSMLGGSSLLCIIQRVPGNRAQVGNGKTIILTTTSSSLTRRSPVATREDACPSLLMATTTIPQVIMSSRWSMLVSTPGSPPLRRTSMRFRTLCTNILSGEKK